MLLLTLLMAHGIGFPIQDTTRYVVLNHGREAGELVVAVGAESAAVRYQYVDRISVTRLETGYRFTADGGLLGAVVREPGGSAGGDIVEQFEVAGDSVRWSFASGPPGDPRGRQALQRGSARAQADGFYLPRSVTPFDQARLARHLLRRPRHTSTVWPLGEARLEIVADTSVPTPAGTTRLRLAMVFAGDQTPFGVWLDERDQLFATEVNWFITVRRGAESSLATLRRIEMAYRNAQAEALARRITTPVGSALVVHNGDVFDSERGVVRPRTSVVVRDGRIVAVGPADSIQIPDGATAIDATGKAVIPGLWDMHGHTQLRHQYSRSQYYLATGITTVRDMASDLDVAVSHRDRAAAGLLASPRMILAGFLDGPGERAGPTEAIVSTTEEALAWVALYDSAGYRQIKLYDSVHPDLVGVIAGDARSRGLRVSGHVPEGLRVPDVLQLGYDELTHLEFLLWAFLPDSMSYFQQRRRRDVEQGIRTMTGVVAGAEMTRLIESLKARRIVVEPTLNFYHARLGTIVPENVWDSTFGFMVRRLNDAGVTLVAGTDGPPARYLVELQLYERAGIPAAQVLQIATINAARVMNDDAEYGSIAVGKVADLVIVNGRPAERIANLANVEVVVRAGRVYDVAVLRAGADRRQ